MPAASYDTCSGLGVYLRMLKALTSGLLGLRARDPRSEAHAVYQKL